MNNSILSKRERRYPYVKHQSKGNTKGGYSQGSLRHRWFFNVPQNNYEELCDGAYGLSSLFEKTLTQQSNNIVDLLINNHSKMITLFINSSVTGT